MSPSVLIQASGVMLFSVYAFIVGRHIYYRLFNLYDLFRIFIMFIGLLTFVLGCRI